MTRAGGRRGRSLHCAKRIGRLAVALWLVAGVALGAPKDKSANKAIDRAINEQYVTTDFKGAQKALIEVVSKCGSDCSPKVVARAWMYVGLVRAMGLQDKQGAEEAFGLAVAVDPKVVLDEGLASPEVKKRFLSIKASAGSVADADADADAPAADADADEGEDDDSGEAATPSGDGEVFCAPVPSEVEAGRRIPIQCAAPEGATVELLYKAPGSTKWTKAKMDEVSAEKGTFRGEVPCKRTAKRGGIKWYVRAKANGDEVGSAGSKSKPNRIKLVGETSEEPPSYPGSKAPARCDGEDDDDSGAADEAESEGEDDAADGDEDADADEDEAPPAAPPPPPKVKGAWGATCEADDQCEEGLLCLNGGCESPNKCETDADCEDEGAYCSGDGVCEHGEVGHFPLRLNWVGASVSMDLLTVGGSEVCRPNDPGDDPEDPEDDVMGSPAGLIFQCLTRQAVLDDEGEETDDFALQPYGPPNLPADITDRSGRVAGGIAPGTLRIMLNYERLLRNGGMTFGVEARAGLILLDSLPSTRTFIPLHLELRGKYYFGDNPFEHSRFRPFVSIGGGLGSSSTSLRVDVDDCNFAQKDTRVDGEGNRLLNAAGGVSRDDGDSFYQGTAAAPTQPSDMQYESMTATELCLDYLGEPGGNPQRSVRASGDGQRGPLAVFRAGPAFASAGLGAMIAVGERHGFEISVEGAILLPTFAFALRPTLGYVVGF